MKTIIILLISLFLGEKRSCLQADIVILADYSGSIQGHEKFIYSAVFTFINQFDLSEEELKIGVIKFNGIVTEISPLTGNKYELLRNVSKLESTPGYATTNLLGAIQEATNELLGPNSRPGYRKIIIVISDGMPDEPHETLVASSMLKAANFQIYGVLIGSSQANEAYMELLSSPNCYLKTDYNSLVKTIQKLDICL